MCRDIFCAENFQNSAAPKGRTYLEVVAPQSRAYKRIRRDLLKTWSHPGKAKPDLYVLYKVVWPEEQLQPFLDHRRDVNATESERISGRCNEQWLYHGTKKACELGETRGKSTPCTLPNCNLCNILRNSFKVARCGANRPSMFGLGIYVTEVSSKADNYSLNIPNPNGRRAIILSRVVAGTMYKTTTSATHLTDAPVGYDCVHGTPGDELMFSETVVYNNNAIRPAYVLVYDYQPLSPVAG